MNDHVDDPRSEPEMTGPPKLAFFHHVAIPCRDVEDGIRFYRDALGGELIVQQPAFALFKIAGTRIGIGSAGCSFVEAGAEYPHFAFKVGPDELVHMKKWLTRCGVPTSNLWTRQGVETLMFFRDPSGNVIELFCEGDYEGAEDLPRGPARGHGTAVDIDALRYSEWHLPDDPG